MLRYINFLASPYHFNELCDFIYVLVLINEFMLICFLAISFKNAKAYDQAIASYTKQADVLKQTGSTFHAAK